MPRRRSGTLSAVISKSADKPLTLSAPTGLGTVAPGAGPPERRLLNPPCLACLILVALSPPRAGSSLQQHCRSSQRAIRTPRSTTQPHSAHLISTAASLRDPPCLTRPARRAYVAPSANAKEPGTACEERMLGSPWSLLARTNRGDPTVTQPWRSRWWASPPSNCGDRGAALKIWDQQAQVTRREPLCFLRCLIR
jgi:hypothetical protein